MDSASKTERALDSMEGSSQEVSRQRSRSRSLRKSSMTMDSRVGNPTPTKMVDDSKPMTKIFQYLGAIVAEILIFGVFIATFFWVFYFEGGVAWQDDVKRQFNLHFALMTAGVIFFNGQAILMFRILPNIRRVFPKTIHVLCNILGTACIAVGFFVAFTANERVSRGAHFYSLHSWLAFGTCGFLALQLLSGSFCFIFLRCCESTASFREGFKPTHANLGLAMITVGSATLVTGFMQAVRARLNGQNINADYRDFPNEGIFVNAISVGIFMLVVVLILLISKRKF